MLCFFSVSRPLTVFIKEELLKNDIFAYQSSFPDLESAHGIRDHIASLPEPPTVAIIDAVEDLGFGENMCVALRSKFPGVRCISIIDISRQPMTRFKYLASSDAEIDISSISDVRYLLYESEKVETSPPVREYRHLSLEGDKYSASLLGYKLPLTKTEYRILLFLCQNTDEAISENIILGYCFSESYRMTETNVRTHVSSINKKAGLISGRRLILSHRGKGYILNEFM